MPDIWLIDFTISQVKKKQDFTLSYVYNLD